MSFMKLKIQQRGATNWKEHRGDLESCPSCNKQMSILGWQKRAHTLYLAPRM